MAIVIRGKAQVNGIAGTFDAYLYATQQDGKLTQEWKEEIIADSVGGDASIRAWNEMANADFSLKLLGDTQAHAMAPAQVVAYSAGSAGAAVSTLGQPFLAPLSCINFTASSPTCAAFTGAYQLMSGTGVDLNNLKVGDLTIKVRRWADSTQNTLMNTVPA